MNYMEIHKKNYPYVVTIADKPFYKELNLWLRQNYKIVNDPMPDGFKKGKIQKKGGINVNQYTKEA